MKKLPFINSADKKDKTRNLHKTHESDMKENVTAKLLKIHLKDLFWRTALRFSFVFILLPLNILFGQEGKPIENMSLEEKVGQLFMTYFSGEEVNEEARTLIENHHLGGVIYYNWSNGLYDAFQIQNLSYDLQKVASQSDHWPLFIAADQEGGLVARLQNGFTEFPGNAALGRCSDPHLSEKAAYAIGLEINAVGINMNLAPVADINVNPRNPIIGIRSFGSDIDETVKHVERSIIGYLRAGILPVLKHFPGHGDVTVDSHKTLPSINKSIEEIGNAELKPFAELNNLSPAIMSGHLLVPEYDENRCATVSPIIIKNILKKRLGFEGLTITDSLTMSGVLDQTKTVEEASIQAFLAGHDILLIGGRDLQNRKSGETDLSDMQNILAAFVHAIRNGRIPEESVNSSVEKIIKWKQAMKIGRNLIKSPSLINRFVQTKENLELSSLISKCSVEVIQGSPPLNLNKNSSIIVAPKTIENKIRKALNEWYFSPIASLFYEELSPTKEDEERIIANMPEADNLIFVSYNSWKYSQQIELFNKIRKNKKSIVFCVRDPQDSLQFKNADIVIRTYSPTSVSIRTALNWLDGSVFRLPVSEKEFELIGKGVWNNESSGNDEHLTFWKEGEEFPSMGIGHFIWPPENYQGTFSQGRFHEVLAFLQKHGSQPPRNLRNRQYSPWKTRDEFYKDFHSSEMCSLRHFLKENIPLQTLYLKERLDLSMIPLTLSLPQKERKNLIRQYFKLANSEQGRFILIDYLNFKHEGTAELEKYRGKGWGLIQVLSHMATMDPNLPPTTAFIESAKKTLIERVKNSPGKRMETRWIPGWFNRLERYEKAIMIE